MTLMFGIDDAISHYVQKEYCGPANAFACPFLFAGLVAIICGPVLATAAVVLDDRMGVFTVAGCSSDFIQHRLSVNVYDFQCPLVDSNWQRLH